MKHASRPKLAIALLTAGIGAAVMSALTSCALSNLEDGPYLQDLKKHCEQVASRLVSDGIDAHCNKNRWAVIEDDGVTYSASEYGIQWIDTDVAFISRLDTSNHGTIPAFTISVGGGVDGAKARYSMSNLSQANASRWGDDIDWVQRTIEASISTQEMKALITQAERYQKLIRTKLDNLK